ncbi:MAG TPA: formyltransferase family protein [Ignavibacteria bacterium]|nr:formyltransferase family protein [Ignavibacteria bacterium]
MNYFYLAHSVMSLDCLKDLVSKNYSPALVIIHKSRDRKKLSESFYSPMIEFCRSKKIELIETEDINNLKKRIENFKTGICVGFMDILNKDFFEIPENGILNLHSGKLPEYRGRAPISRSIMNGEKYVTVSVHKIDEGVDSGDICKELKIEIAEEDDVNTIYKKCSESASVILVDCLNELKGGKLEFHKQESDERANKIINNEERKINWESNAVINYNKIRALTAPYPCAYSIFKGSEYLFLKAKTSDEFNDENLQSGTVVKVSDNEIVIKSGNGFLRIFKVTDENLNEVNFKELFNEGDIFE